MEVLFEKSFGRDLKKIKDKRLLQQVQEAIIALAGELEVNDLLERALKEAA